MMSDIKRYCGGRGPRSELCITSNCLRQVANGMSNFSIFRRVYGRAGDPPSGSAESASWRKKSAQRPALPKISTVSALFFQPK